MPLSFSLERFKMARSVSSKMAALAEKSKKFSAKKAIIFDLDGTLTASKANLDQEMASLLCRLLEKKKVLVIGGGNLPQFRNQFLNYLTCPVRSSRASGPSDFRLGGSATSNGAGLKEKFDNIFIAPTSGASMYKNKNGKWQEIYRYTLSLSEKRKIMSAFKDVFHDTQYSNPEKIYGQVIEDRESQITFSALGQKAPLAAKEKWHKESDIRPALKSALEKYLPEFEVRLGGLTSIDVTKKGVDKAYGVRQIAKILKIPTKGMVYVGDALYEGGNDAVVKKTEIPTLQVDGLEDTKFFVRALLSFTNSSR